MPWAYYDTPPISVYFTEDEIRKLHNVKRSRENPKPRTITDAERKLARDLLAQGLSARAVSRKLGRSADTINRLRDEGGSDESG